MPTKTRHEDTLGLSQGVDKRAQRPCRTPGSYPGLGEGREQQGSGSPKCCVHGHISTSPSGSTSRLSKGITRLGSVTGLSTGLPASRKCSHLTEMSKGGRSSLGEDEPGQEQGKPPPGEWNKGAQCWRGCLGGGKSIS